MIRGVARERIRMPQVRVVTALMYHGVHEGPSAPPEVPDDGYAVSGQRLAEHLDSIAAARLPVTTLCDLGEPGTGTSYTAGLPDQAVVLTFNDGAASHLDPVLHLLWERNMPGEFFVNPVNVGRSGYLSWSELRGMASAGMSIQSHGYSPRYLDDLDDVAVANELLRSKKVIEDRVGQAVTVFAAPGGRINSFIAAMARRVGYRVVCGSRPGQWRVQAKDSVVPRIPIRAWTSSEEIGRWIRNRPFALAAQTGRYRMLQMARWALGNHVYDNLRQRYLGDH